MSELAFKVSGLSKSYGSKVVLDDLSFSVNINDFSVIWGKPGNGKSVLVRSIMGLERIDAGEVIVRGEDVTNKNAGSRNIGYIPQSFALFPHYSVRENIEYPLNLIKASDADKEKAVNRVAELLRIEDLLHKKPTELSGGQKQRIAIARGLVITTDVYLLDDPLVGLDFKLRERLIDDLRRTQEELKVAFIYVTSDPLEALSLAKTVLVLSKGKIVQQGSLTDVYDNPQTVQSMSALGFPEPNFVPGKISNGTFTSDIFSAQVNAPDGISDAIAGIRPEGLVIGENAKAITLEATVALVENLGSENVIYLKVKDRMLVTVISRTDEENLKIVEEAKIKISILPHAIQLFRADSEVKIGEGKHHE
ncbi:MAG: ABC transporter ATP-binding protein [Actinobacteria bacterium]|nr:ABC transporter ATP-binding protein [Actinomycetota bacterium]